MGSLFHRSVEGNTVFKEESDVYIPWLLRPFRGQCSQRDSSDLELWLDVVDSSAGSNRDYY